MEPVIIYCVIHQPNCFCFVVARFNVLRCDLIYLQFVDAFILVFGGGGGGFTRPIPRDGGADQFRGIPIVGRLPTDGTRGPEEKGCGRKWPDAEGLVQGSRARDVRDPVI